MSDNKPQFIPFDSMGGKKDKATEKIGKSLIDEGKEDPEKKPEEGIIGTEIKAIEPVQTPANLGVTEDRRDTKRKSLKLNKVFAGEVGEGLDIAPVYLYIINISVGGMRVTCDMDMPLNYVFHLNLAIDSSAPLDTNIKVIWKKDLFGGTKIMGIKFVNPSEKTNRAILEFMERYSEEGKRRAFRLDRVLPVELEIEKQTEKFNTLTMDLSTVGMKISNPFPLPFDKKISLKLMLDFEESPVYLGAKVVWQKETTYDQYVVGIEFVGIRDEDKGRINLYIDRAISGELDRKIVKELPEEVFEFPLKRYTDEQRRSLGMT